VGEVCVIYSREHTVGDWKYTNYVAELKIDQVDGFSNENTDGGFNVIGANGFDLIKKTPAKKGE